MQGDFDDVANVLTKKHYGLDSAQAAAAPSKA